MVESLQTFSTEVLKPGTRIACSIEYDGTAYSGWQAQPQLEVLTVQEQLEAALSTVASAPVRVHCAGRTDTGVHATSQIIHFDAPVARSAKAWIIGSNANLPYDIRVRWATAVPESFHARFSALSRRYRYLIFNSAIRSAHFNTKLTWQRRLLNHEAMHAEAQCLLGELDFSSFRAASCQSSTPMRNIHSISVSRHRDIVVIEVTANAFLHHMVRNLAGSLIAVGTGVKPSGWIRQVLERRDRTEAAETAPANGLYLVQVAYPSEYELPLDTLGPLFLQD